MVLRGICWDLLDKVLNQGVSFVVSILLARLLSPEDFGLVGMVMVVVSFSQVFMDMGFSSALVQKQDVTDEQYSTVFYINVLAGLALTSALFLSSGLVASLYEKPLIADMGKAVSVLFFINSLTIVQNAKYIKAVDLKLPAICRAVAVITSGLVGTLMAYQGYGVWSLVAQSILNALVFTLLIWVKSSWLPKAVFSLKSVKPLWSFGSKLFASGLLESIFTRLDIFIIGKIFTPATLGFYIRAQTLNNLVVHYSSGSLMKVLFPIISKNQDNIHRVQHIYSKAIVMVALLAFGLLGLLYVSAENLIVLLFTEKWLPSVDYFKILMLGGYAYPLSAVMVNIISGRGKSGDFFRLEIVKKMMMALTLIIGFQFGISGFLVGMVIFSFLAVLANMYFVSKEIAISIVEQVSLILPYILFTFIAVGFTLVLKEQVQLPRFQSLLVESTMVASMYVLLNVIFNTKAVSFLKEKFLTRNRISV